jgi:hypothetical protein
MFAGWGRPILICLSAGQWKISANAQREFLLMDLRQAARLTPALSQADNHSG